MESVFEPIIKKVRRERLGKCQDQAGAGKSPLDMEALIRRCVFCKQAAAQIQDYESKRPFSSLDTYRSSHLNKVMETIETCPKCGEEGWKVHLSVYCQYRRKHRLDIQIIAERDKPELVCVSNLEGEVWELPSELANKSIDQAVFETPKSAANASSAGGDSKSQKLSRAQSLEVIQKILVEFEDHRDDDPSICGPKNLPASVLNNASAFADLNSSEVPLVVVSSSTADIGTEGLLITSEQIHSSESAFESLPFGDIVDVELRSGLLSSSVIYINGHKALAVRGFLESNSQQIVDTLKKLSNLERYASRNSEGARNRRTTGSRKRPARAGMKRRSPKPGIRQTRVVRSIGMRAGETSSSVPRRFLEEQLGKLTERKIPGDLVHVGEIPREFVSNAKRTYARMETDDNPMAFIRSHLGDEAAEALISEMAIFSNELQAPRGLRFEEIEDAVLVEEEGVQFIDINGQPFLSQGLLPKWVLPAIVEVLNNLSSYNGSTSRGPEPVAAQHDDEPVSPGSSRFGRMRRGRRLSSTGNRKPTPQPNTQTNSMSPDSGRRSPSRVSSNPSRTNLSPPRRNSTRTGMRAPSRTNLRQPTNTNLRRPTPSPSGPRRSPSRTRLNPGTRSLDGTAYNSPRSGTGHRRPSRVGNSPRHRTSQVTAPPSFSRGGPPPRNNATRGGASRQLSRPLAPRGIDLDAIDFDLEIVQQANTAWRLGRLENAVQSVESAMTVNPMNAELSYAHASMLAALGERVAALDSFVNAIRFGFADQQRVLQDACWARYRQDPDYQRLLRRVEQRSRHEESERLEQIRLALVYMLAHMTHQLPAEARVTRCPQCFDVRLDPAQADYGYDWQVLEAFQLDAVAPLAMEQLHCQNCNGYSVEIIGTVHGFALARQEALHIVHWLDAGQVRCRFVFRSDPNGFLTEERTFTTVQDAGLLNLSTEIDSMCARLISPVRDIVECAVRDLGIPGNDIVIPTLHESLERLCHTTDAGGRLQDPWLVREFLETYVAIGSGECLDSIFTCVSQLLSHEELDEAVAMATVQAVNALGGVNISLELANYVQENIRNASPDVIRAFALAMLDEAEHTRAQQLAHIAEDILGFVGSE